MSDFCLKETVTALDTFPAWYCLDPSQFGMFLTIKRLSFQAWRSAYNLCEFQNRGYPEGKKSLKTGLNNEALVNLGAYRIDFYLLQNKMTN